ncbi:hypothetical protein [Flavobacterium anhuiense]|uniref:Uncharacterized protein n=1 Tax=Flavobacterium anhuiense TaxID=459526 RepID=A0ABY0LNV7_9FLAO|nr:hypothetical protein [Flavobacterium anhuiense]SCY44514.1 hypothetical protein SAMN02927916_2105 [Flavobacterium anhuiense]
MFKYDLPTAVPTLHNLKKIIEDFLNESITLDSIEKIKIRSDFEIEVREIFKNYQTSSHVYDLDFQYKKLIQIVNDIRQLNLAVDNEIPEWLENELETVFRKIRNILLVLEIESN